MKKRLAMMLMLVMTLCAGSAAAETLTIGMDGQVVDAGTTADQVIIPVGITKVTFKGVSIHAKPGAHALHINSTDVKLIFEGVNSFYGGGGLYSCNGIYAAGNVTISGSGSVTATGSGSEDGGDGIQAGGNVTISGSGSVTANGGKGLYGGNGIYADGDVRISGSGSVTANGGTGLYVGDGIRASRIVIEDSVPTGGLTARGGDGYSSYGSEGSFSAEQIATIDKYPDDPQWFEYVAPEELDDEENPPQNGDLPQTGSLPQTGDPSMLGAWALLLGASAAGLRLRRKK